MSQDLSPAILAELRHLRVEIDDLKSELAQYRRGQATPYYTTAQLMRLAQKSTPKALHCWAARKGLQSHGHNQWPMREANQILQIN